MDISHVNRGNYVLHIVRGGGRGSGGLSPKIRPCVEDLFLAYLLRECHDIRILYVEIYTGSLYTINNLTYKYYLQFKQTRYLYDNFYVKYTISYKDSHCVTQKQREYVIFLRDIQVAVETVPE
jgi:hypothetical protein